MSRSIWTSVLTMSLVGLTGCDPSSSKSGADTAAQSAGSLSISGSGGSTTTTPTPTPIPVTTPTPPPIAADPAGSCRDAGGTLHLNQDSWSPTAANIAPYLCPNSNENYAPMANALTVTCINGAIVQTAESLATTRSVNACTTPTLSITTPSSAVHETSSATLQIGASDVSTLTYKCTDSLSGSSLSSGSVADGAASFSVSVSNDMNCQLFGVAADGTTVSVSAGLDVDCGNKIKVGSHCEDFTCKTFVALAPSADGHLEAPARTAAGVCYSYKLMSAIANSSSKLTTAIDTSIISRNHDVSAQNPDVTHNPYSMGESNLVVKIDGPRTLKLAGSGDSLAPILVDNFVVTGIYPASIASPVVSDFHAYGTSDSTVGTTGGVLWNNQVVPLVPFATGGTSTIAPLDITAQVDTTQAYQIDVKALDAGGSRQLSDIYLVFQ